MTDPPRDAHARQPAAKGFTLIELLAAMLVLSIVLVAVVVSLQGVQSAWRLTRTAVREHTEGRRALETVAISLSRATLASRWAPDHSTASLTGAGPTALATESDLHFVSGPGSLLLPNLRNRSGHAVFFQGPFGFAGTARGSAASPDSALYRTLPHVLNAWGYYVVFGPDPVILPSFMTAPRQGRPAPPRKYRFRLMEFRQPAHELPLLLRAPGADRPALAALQTRDALYDWFRQPVFNSQAGAPASERRASVVAENILALVVVPYDPQLGILRDGASASNAPYQLAPDYHYDSRRFQWEPGSALGTVTRHALPPSVEIAVVALGEDDWENLNQNAAMQQGESLLGFMSGLFQVAANFRHDLDTLERELIRRRLSHQIMTRVVSLHGLAGRVHPPVGIPPAASTAAAP